MRSSPFRLIRGHYKSFEDPRDGKVRGRVAAEFVIPPMVAGALSVLLGVKMPSGASVGLLTVAGLLSAFMFGVVLQVSERAMDWADSQPERSKANTEHALFLQEIAGNAGYAAVVSIATAIVFAIATVADKALLIAATAVGIALFVHMVQLMILIMDRVYATNPRPAEHRPRIRKERDSARVPKAQSGQRRSRRMTRLVRV